MPPTGSSRVSLVCTRARRKMTRSTVARLTNRPPPGLVSGSPVIPANRRCGPDGIPERSKVQLIVDRSGLGSRSSSRKPPGTGIAGPDGGEELPVIRVAMSLPWVVTCVSASKMAPDCKPSRTHWYLCSAWSKPGAVNSYVHCHRPSGVPGWLVTISPSISGCSLASVISASAHASISAMFWTWRRAVSAPVIMALTNSVTSSCSTASVSRTATRASTSGDCEPT